jgi:hypothetical protein
VPTWQLPFKQHYFEVLVSNPQNLPAFEEYLKNTNLSHAPIYLGKFYLAESLLEKQKSLSIALELNPLNDLNLHKLYLETQSPESIYYGNYLQLLKDYNELLSVNAHNLIATLNKDTVLAIYDLLETSYNGDTEELDNLKQEFLRIYDLELNKFNNRFYSK